MDIIIKTEPPDENEYIQARSVPEDTLWQKKRSKLHNLLFGCHGNSSPRGRTPEPQIQTEPDSFALIEHNSGQEYETDKKKDKMAGAENMLEDKGATMKGEGISKKVLVKMENVEEDDFCEPDRDYTKMMDPFLQTNGSPLTSRTGSPIVTSSSSESRSLLKSMLTCPMSNIENPSFDNFNIGSNENFQGKYESSSEIRKMLLGPPQTRSLTSTSVVASSASVTNASPVLSKSLFSASNNPVSSSSASELLKHLSAQWRQKTDGNIHTTPFSDQQMSEVTKTEAASGKESTEDLPKKSTKVMKKASIKSTEQLKTGKKPTGINKDAQEKDVNSNDSDGSPQHTDDDRFKNEAIEVAVGNFTQFLQHTISKHDFTPEQLQFIMASAMQSASRVISEAAKQCNASDTMKETAASFIETAIGNAIKSGTTEEFKKKIPETSEDGEMKTSDDVLKSLLFYEWHKVQKESKHDETVKQTSSKPVNKSAKKRKTAKGNESEKVRKKKRKVDKNSVEEMAEHGNVETDAVGGHLNNCETDSQTCNLAEIVIKEEPIEYCEYQSENMKFLDGRIDQIEQENPAQAMNDPSPDKTWIVNTRKAQNQTLSDISNVNETSEEIYKMPNIIIKKEPEELVEYGNIVDKDMCKSEENADADKNGTIEKGLMVDILKDQTFKQLKESLKTDLAYKPVNEEGERNDHEGNGKKMKRDENKREEENTQNIERGSLKEKYKSMYMMLSKDKNEVDSDVVTSGIKLDKQGNINGDVENEGDSSRKDSRSESGNYSPDLSMVKTEPVDVSNEVSRGDGNPFADSTKKAVSFTKFLDSEIEKNLKKTFGIVLYTKDDKTQSKGNQNVYDDVNGSEKQSVFKCEICGLEFEHKGTLKVHQRGHNAKKSCQCPICGKLVTDKSYLKIHLRTHETNFDFLNKANDNQKAIPAPGKPDKKILRCETCLLQFSNYEHFELHSRMHNGEKLFKCGDCGMGFENKHQLASHEGIHTGVKPFKCSKCDMSFRQNSGLRLHLLVHEEEKPKKCPFCDASFSRKAHLDKHIRYHSGERPFVCDICSKRFIDKELLKQHTKKVHPDGKLGQRPVYKDRLIPSHLEEKIGPKWKGFQTLYDPSDKSEVPKSSYPCGVCGETYDDINLLVEHLETHNSTSDEVEDESDMVSEEQGSENAVSNNHGNSFTDYSIRGILNSKIGSSYPEGSDSSSSLELAGIKVEKMFKCPFCDVSFDLPGARIRHIHKMHPFNQRSEAVIDPSDPDFALKQHLLEYRTTVETLFQESGGNPTNIPTSSAWTQILNTADIKIPILAQNSHIQGAGTGMQTPNSNVKAQNSNIKMPNSDIKTTSSSTKMVKSETVDSAKAEISNKQSEGVVKLPCPYCDRVYQRQSSRTRHINENHRDKKEAFRLIKEIRDRQGPFIID